MFDHPQSKRSGSQWCVWHDKLGGPQHLTAAANGYVMHIIRLWSIILITILCDQFNIDSMLNEPHEIAHIYTLQVPFYVNVIEEWDPFSKPTLNNNNADLSSGQTLQQLYYLSITCFLWADLRRW